MAEVSSYPFASHHSESTVESATATLLKFHRLSTEVSLATEQAGIEFFKAVFLDNGSGGKPAYQTYTRPLVVRKKKSGRLGAGNTSPQLRKRRSVSTSRSPISSHIKAFERLTIPSLHSISSPPGSTSSLNPHHSIAHAFLTQPIDSPIPAVIIHPAADALREQRTGSVTSELHLGLGRFQAYDEAIRPGPSPPTSPQPSPTRRQFCAAAARIPRQRAVSSPRGSVSGPSGRRAHRAEPPMTPSRAPSKAAAILGEVRSQCSSPSSASKSTRKNVQHFRPLPSSKALEIDLFFGDVPRKRPTKPRAPSRKGESKLETSAGVVGEGKSAATHVGENGSLWMDVEEEQEFAWLLSEVTNRRATLHHAPQAGLELPEVIIVEGNGSDEEDVWGMQAYTSVLDMPKQKALAKAEQAAEARAEFILAPTAPSTPPSQVSHPQSFLDVDPYASTSTQRTATPSTPPGRTCAQHGDFSLSPTSFDGNVSSSPSRSPKAKHRPPPLTLRGKPSSTRLPVLAVVETSSAPETTAACPRPSKPLIPQPRPKTAQNAPSTPFVRPRVAPVPAPVTLPIPAPAPMMQTISPTVSDSSQPQSFFEAPSPIGGFRVSLAKKMKWGIGKVVNVKNAINKLEATLYSITFLCTVLTILCPCKPLGDGSDGL